MFSLAVTSKDTDFLHIIIIINTLFETGKFTELPKKLHSFILFFKENNNKNNSKTKIKQHKIKKCHITNIDILIIIKKNVLV